MKLVRILSCLMLAAIMLFNGPPLSLGVPYTCVTLSDSSGKPGDMFILYDAQSHPQMAGYSDAQLYSIDPVLENGHYLVPLRQMAEILGFTADFQPLTSEITLNSGSDTIVLNLNNNTAYVNGQARVVDPAPRLISDRTMVPIRFISENMGYFVSFDEGFISISDCAFISRDEMTRMLDDTASWSAPSSGSQTALPGTRTPQGIGVGDSIDAVIGVYGQPGRSFVYDPSFTGSLFYYDNFHYQGSSDSLELVFQEGVITQMLLHFL